MGKPDPIIYEAAMSLLGLDASEVLAIGDSLEHDIKGKYCLCQPLGAFLLLAAG